MAIGAAYISNGNLVLRDEAGNLLRQKTLGAPFNPGSPGATSSLRVAGYTTDRVTVRLVDNFGECVLTTYDANFNQLFTSYGPA
jgi:hypothetical protein